MSHGLFERIGRLLRADAHGVVDALEERGLLVRQHLREAELALRAKQARLEATGALIERLERVQARLDERRAQLDADVERALAQDDEAGRELARFAARRWLATGRASERTARRLARSRPEHARLAEEVARQTRELAELEERARDAELRPDRAMPAPGGDVADEEVELELLRRRTLREERA